jgi:hypothetical protein
MCHYITSQKVMGLIPKLLDFSTDVSGIVFPSLFRQKVSCIDKP